MAHSLLFVLILLATILRFNCLQRSDWTYDPKTGLANVTTNGTTHSCRPYDIIAPIATREPCLYGKTPQDCPSNISKSEYIRAVNASVNSSCVVSIPTAEETLERIEKVYRSSSLDDNPATQKWYNRVSQNLTRLERECRENGSGPLLPAKVNFIRQSALTVFDVGRVNLPQLRKNVSNALTLLQEALKRAADVNISLSATFSDELRSREQLVILEVNAISDSHRNELTLTWQHLAKWRIEFVEKMSLNYTTEPPVTAEAQEVAKIRMDMLSKMAAANEMLAYIEFSVKEIASRMKTVCPTRDDYDEMEI